ncbi:MAG: Unknown protein, partial [uncultured Sulfurovum sp.]
MKKNLQINLGLLSFITLFGMNGCVGSTATPAMVTSGKGGVMTGTNTVEYISCHASTGKKLTVTTVKCKSTACKEQPSLNGNAQVLLTLMGKDTQNFSGMGDGLSNMLQTSLDKTGCFEVLDREVMENLREEMKLAGKTMTVESADILVTGAITSVSLAKSKSSFIGFSKNSKKATLGMDMKVIDVHSSKVVLSQDYSAESGKTNYAYISDGYSGSTSGMSDASMEEVARNIIDRLTYDIVKKFASNQYKIEKKVLEN